LILHIKGETKAEGFRQYSAEKAAWAREGGSNLRLKKTA